MTAETLGVDATPFFFIDGKPIGTPAQATDLEAFLR